MLRKSNSSLKNKNIVATAIDLINASRNYVVKQTNSVMVFTYFQLGKLIIENEQAGKIKAAYGKQTIILLSKRLTAKFGKGFSERNLEQMRSFYLAFSTKQNQLPIPQPVAAKFKSIQKPQPVAAESSLLKATTSHARKSFADVFPLSWSHYIILSRISNEHERSFYEIESIQGNWGKRELQRQINSGLFERIALSKNKKKVKQLATKGQLIDKPEDVLKSSYVLEFLGLDEKAEYSETDLESAIINRIEHFLLEMGKGFLFQGRQVRFSFDEDDFYVDLVLYNRLLQCFVLVDLKIGKLKHQDLGQMQMYVNYYDRFVKTVSEKATIGIIICKDKSDAMVEITLPKNNKAIFAKQYKLYLPSKTELKKVVEG